MRHESTSRRGPVKSGEAHVCEGIRARRKNAVSLFPSQVLTCSGSKGIISARSASTPKVWLFSVTKIETFAGDGSFSRKNCQKGRAGMPHARCFMQKKSPFQSGKGFFFEKNLLFSDHVEFHLMLHFLVEVKRSGVFAEGFYF